MCQGCPGEQTLQVPPEEITLVCSKWWCFGENLQGGFLEDPRNNQWSPRSSCWRQWWISASGSERSSPAKKQDTKGRVDFVKKHIGSFPTYTSHYFRSDNPNRKYLSSQLSLSKLYELYEYECASQSVEPVSEWVYRNVFNKQFNLSFGRYIHSHASHTHTHTHTHSPHTHTHTHITDSHLSTHTRSLFSPRTDTCKTCDGFKTKVDVEKDPDVHLTFDWDLHKIRADGAYQYLREWQSHQMTLKCLRLTFNRHYLHPCWQLVLFSTRNNCGLITWVLQDWSAYVAWRNSIAGSDEIGSCVLHRIHHLSSGTPKLILYSDSCGGQNRNMFVYGYMSSPVLYSQSHR